MKVRKSKHQLPYHQDLVDHLKGKAYFNQRDAGLTNILRNAAERYCREKNLNSNIIPMAMAHAIVPQRNEIEAVLHVSDPRSRTQMEVVNQNLK